MNKPLIYNSPAYDRIQARVRYLEITAANGVPLSPQQRDELSRERAKLATAVVVAAQTLRQDDQGREDAIAALRVQGALA